MNVMIVGAGYVGLTTGVVLAYLGHQVTLIERQEDKLKALQAGRCPIYEPALEDLLACCQGRLSFSDQISAGIPNVDVIFIAVGTPLASDGAADLRQVDEAARQIAEAVVEGRSYTVVMKSTVPMGTNRMMEARMRHVLQQRGVACRIQVASNPEFLREGAALSDTLYPDRIIVGADEERPIVTLRELYAPILQQDFQAPAVLPRPQGYDVPAFIGTSMVTAEMTKYAANAFLAAKVSLINEMAGLCEKVGADITDVSRGVGADPRIGSRFLNAGLGWGGSCFPKDTAALLSIGLEYGYQMPIVEASRIVNMRQRTLVVEKLQATLKVISGRCIGVLGLTYKPYTDDLRESPAVDLVRQLVERGARIQVHDPVAPRSVVQEMFGPEVVLVASPDEAACMADALVLATEWNEYRNLDFGRVARLMRTPLLVDGRNLFDPKQVRAAGLQYVGMGR